MNMIKFICVGSILTAITVMFQSTPIFLPAIGLTLSPLSTLPVAIAAIISISLGFSVYVSASIILTLVSVEEALILIFTTGLLGLVIGALIYRKGILISLILSSIALTIGMILLTFVIGMSAFKDFSNSFQTSVIILIFSSFSLIYSIISNIIIRRFMNYLMRLNLYN